MVAAKAQKTRLWANFGSSHNPRNLFWHPTGSHPAIWSLYRPAGVGSRGNRQYFNQFLYILLIEVLTVYLLWLFLSQRQIPWADIGLKKPKLAHLGLSVPVFGVYFLLATIALILVETFLPGINVDQKQQIGFENAMGSELILVFAGLVIMPAIVEEILVRGFLYGGLVKKFPKLLAAFIASGIFALAHLQFGSGQPLLWIAAIDTFILSMVLIWLRDRTGNIWSGVIVHMIKNGLAFISLFILKLS